MKIWKHLAILAIVSISLFSFSACGNNDDDGEGAITLTFRPVFDDESLAMFSEGHELTDDIDLRFQLVQFFMTNVALFTHSGSTTPLTDVELINFESLTDENLAEKGITIKIDHIKPGDYAGIKLNAGVMPTLNATTPSDYMVGDPLAGNYWTAASSYVFYKLEGNADTLGTGIYDYKFTYHIGGNANLVPLEFDHDIEVYGNKITNLDFDLDVRKLLVEEDGTVLDISRFPVNHQETSPVAQFISGNFARALELK